MKTRESGMKMDINQKPHQLMTRFLISFRNAIHLIFCGAPALCDVPDAGDAPVLCAARVDWDRTPHDVLCEHGALVLCDAQDAGAFPGHPGCPYFPGLDCQSLGSGLD
jgi:hypothetical protein